jgi:hypothetical protein
MLLDSRFFWKYRNILQMQVVNRDMLVDSVGVVESKVVIMIITLTIIMIK